MALSHNILVLNIGSTTTKVAVFENITSAIPKNGSVLITLKEGSGNRTDSDGRIFYLWEELKAREMFDTMGFKVCDFSTSVSKTGSGDVWMSYVLDNAG